MDMTQEANGCVLVWSNIRLLANTQEPLHCQIKTEYYLMLSFTSGNPILCSEQKPLCELIAVLLRISKGLPLIALQGLYGISLSVLKIIHVFRT